jgi:hypothetical protein
MGVANSRRVWQALTDAMGGRATTDARGPGREARGRSLFPDSRSPIRSGGPRVVTRGAPRSLASGFAKIRTSPFPSTYFCPCARCDALSCWGHGRRVRANRRHRRGVRACRVGGQDGQRTVRSAGLRSADDAAASNKHRAKRRKQARAQKKRKKKVQVIPGPPGPQGPPGLAAPVQTCSGVRPITCGDGCCLSTHPLCCDSIDSTSGKSCHLNSFQCCPLAVGGGACGGAFPKCCPAYASSFFGGQASCAEVTDTCCRAGGACPEERPQCCDPTPQFPFGFCCPNNKFCCPDIFSDPNLTACCDSVAECCAADNQCLGFDPPRTCVNGCCVE